MELGADKARPFESIEMELEFDGEAPEFVTAEVTEASLDAPYYTKVKGSNEDGWTLIAPIHPTGIEAGMVEIRAIGDGFECPEAVPLQLEALDRHEGATREAVELSTQLLNRHAEMLGVDPAELETTPADELPAPLWGSAVGWTLLEDPDYPYSMHNVLDGDNEEVAELREHLAVTDALIAESGYLDLLREGLAQLDEIGPADFEQEYSTESNAMPGGLVPLGTTTETRRAALCPAPEFPEIGLSTSALSHNMKLAEYARSMLASEAYENMDMLILAGSLIPSGIGNATAGLVSLLVQAGKQALGAQANTLPSELFNPRVQLTVTSFEEDFDYTGEWKNYLVNARSKGWDPTDLMLENLWAIFGAVLGAANKGIDIASGSAQNATAFATFLENAQGALTGEARSKLFEEAGDEWQACEIAPRVWGPFDLSEPRDSAHEYNGAIAQVRGDRYQYAPAELGEGSVEVYAYPESFPPGSNKEASRVVGDVEVEKITITIDPSPDALEPGETIELRAIVDHALDKSVEWETSAGTITQTIKTDDDGNPIAELTAPPSRDEYPIAVRARSTSTGGLRGGGAVTSDPRFGWGYYRYDEGVIVTPPFACLQPGASQEFSATVQGHPDEVSWSASGGSIEKLDASRASYTAPDEGIHDITATADADPSLTALARVSVGPCKCFAMATWSGAVSGAIGSFNNISYIPVEGKDEFMITFNDEVGDGAVTLMVSQAAPKIGMQEAVFLVAPNGEVGGASPGTLSEEHAGVLNVITLDEHWMEATFSAQLELFQTVFTEHPMPVTLQGTLQLYHYEDTLQANIEGRTCQTTEPVGGM